MAGKCYNHFYGRLTQNQVAVGKTGWQHNLDIYRYGSSCAGEKSDLKRHWSSSFISSSLRLFHPSSTLRFRTSSILSFGPLSPLWAESRHPRPSPVWAQSHCSTCSKGAGAWEDLERPSNPTSWGHHLDKPRFSQAQLLSVQRGSALHPIPPLCWRVTRGEG